MKKTNDRERTYINWYMKNQGLYNQCKETVERLLITLLKKEKIAYHSVESRVKTESSFIQKCMNEKYEKPLDEITDLCGLRIITYTNQDVVKICKLIEKQFRIDRANSIDKSKQMGEDQVGYLSIHYIVSLSNRRAKLEEYKSYANIKFEIQVRTLLQHAWAEIEHDRNYKFSGELPKDIKRRFYLVAGALELLDREFEQISNDIDNYAILVRENAEKGNFDTPIDSTSLIEYLNIKLSGFCLRDKTFHSLDKELINELQTFGINYLQDLEYIMDERVIDSLASSTDNLASYNYIGLLRDLMMIADPQKYFLNAWQNHWQGMTIDDYHRLVELNPDIKNYTNFFKFVG